MAKFKMAAILITVFLTCGSFDKVNAMMDIGDQKGFDFDVFLKRIEALENENLQLKTKIGEMKQKMELQSNETQKISDSFDIIKDEVQEFLPKSSFGNATLKFKYSEKAIKFQKKYLPILKNVVALVSFSVVCGFIMNSLHYSHWLRRK